MTTLPRWRTQQGIQSKTVAEHMVDTNADVLREHLVTSALYDPALDSDTIRDSVLHMYLNECKSGKNKQWYTTTQKAFRTHHPRWKDSFDDILKARWEQGLKSQKANQMGDWIALSQLGGEPLSLNMLFREKLRHPRDPRPPAHFMIPLPKSGLYKHAFELLYNVHRTKDPRWDMLLLAMPLGSLTASLWDSYVENWPDKLETPVNNAVLKSHEWPSLLEELFESKHAAPLAVQIVNRLQSGSDGELTELFDSQNKWQRGFLDEQLMSETLYNAMRTNRKMRQHLSTGQLVHGLNLNPGDVATELHNLPSLNSMPRLWSESRAIFSPPYVEELSEEVRANTVQYFAQNPAVCQPLIAQQFDKITSSNWTQKELQTMLSTPGVQAILVNSIVKGWANTFLDYCATVFPALAEDLNRADFTEDYVFETIVMRHLVPGLCHKDALALTSMAESLGVDEKELVAMYQNAIEGLSSQNSLPIDGLVEASNDSAFPA